MRLEEIIPREPKKKKEYDYARQCLDEAKETGRKFIHISTGHGVNRGHIDAPSEFVYIWYNGVSIFIRANDGPVPFALPLEIVTGFGDCDGVNPRTTWKNKWFERTSEEVA